MLAKSPKCVRLFVGGMCERCLAVELPESQICFKPDLSDCGFFRSGKHINLMSDGTPKFTTYDTDLRP